MVLINNLTVDEINAALLHLQRSQNEVVGGEKGTTIQNITITNQGGGSGVAGQDWSPIINALENRINANEQTDNTQAEQIAGIMEQLMSLSANGITNLQFDATNRYLIIYTEDGNTYDVQITSEPITMTFDSTTNKLTLVMGNQTQEVTLPYINANQKGVAGGVATLDENGRVPYSQLPESAMEFKGEWNASTNTPTLADGTGTNGDFYICNVGGTVNFGTQAEPREVTFVPNDRVIYNGDTDLWIKLPAGQVASVNGQSGVVELDAADIPYNATLSVKDKLDSATQSDWTETDSTDPSFIKHKIPIWITNGTPTIVSEVQQYFDIVHPINEIYVQYPQQKDPNTLYNNGSISSTWTLQTQYEGAFFRSSGGNASSFIEEGNTLTKQSQSTAKNGLKLRSANGESSGTENITASGGVDHTHTQKGTFTTKNTINTGNTNAKDLTGTVGQFEQTSNFTHTGVFSGSTNQSQQDTYGSGDYYGVTVKIDATHRHQIDLSGATSGASAYSHQHNIYLFGDTETRPENYTIKIWKRTA